MLICIGGNKHKFYKLSQIQKYNEYFINNMYLYVQIKAILRQDVCLGGKAGGIGIKNSATNVDNKKRLDNEFSLRSMYQYIAQQRINVLNRSTHGSSLDAQNYELMEYTVK